MDHVKTSTERTALHDLLLSKWEGMTKMLGFQDHCINNGVLLKNGTCKCPHYFEGSKCEKKLCLNGATLESTKLGTVQWECRCPNSQYIHGTHCEQVSCAPSGVLQNPGNGSWHCECSGFYNGRFCEEFELPYSAYAVPLVLLLFVFCLFICRKDMCSRGKRGRTLSLRVRADLEDQHQHQPLHQSHMAARNHEQGDVSRRPAAFPRTVAAPYVVRLDTIPTFNPQMIGGVELLAADQKPLEPPPPYEQALSAQRFQNPPDYEEEASQQTAHHR
ncbi:unnamed protein product [Caenorhabditis auriculariae]|uniref:EGF-like domain-containing protein n=1 Tax=Caenorhabditis auriculariae TaxID=2777116 RepID=A0A8S1GU63_9PELO|nr:unnamed protein product [Caenorhabditis auriculariae]